MSFCTPYTDSDHGCGCIRSACFLSLPTYPFPWYQERTVTHPPKWTRRKEGTIHLRLVDKLDYAKKSRVIDDGSGYQVIYIYIYISTYPRKKVVQSRSNDDWEDTTLSASTLRRALPREFGRMFRATPKSHDRRRECGQTKYGVQVTRCMPCVCVCHYQTMTNSEVASIMWTLQTTTANIGTLLYDVTGSCQEQRRLSVPDDQSPTLTTTPGLQLEPSIRLSYPINALFYVESVSNSLYVLSTCWTLTLYYIYI